MAPALRTDASSFYSLLRNLGGSVGVSLSVGVLARQTQIAHADIGGAVTPFALPGADPNIARALGATGDTVMALLDATVNGQAAMIAYLDDFTLMMWLSIAVIPLILLLRAPRKVGGRPRAYGDGVTYQIRTRSSGFRYSLSPGLTSNAAYHGSKLRTVHTR